MVFYKMQQGQNEVRFQLLQEQPIEDYSVWDNTIHQFKKGNAGIQAINGQLFQVDQTKMMRRDEFKSMFPSLSKKTQYVYDVAILMGAAPTHYSLGMPYSANNLLQMAMQNSRACGINPQEMIYKLRKTGEKLQTTYTITAEERVGLPSNVQEAENKQQQQVGSLTPSPFSYQHSEGFIPSPSASMEQKRAYALSIAPGFFNQPTTPSSNRSATPPVANNLANTATFHTQAAPSYPVQQKVAEMPNKAAPNPFLGQTVVFPLTKEEEAILAMAEQATDTLQEVDFINRFADVLKNTYNITPDMARVAAIYRQWYMK